MKQTILNLILSSLAHREAVANSAGAAARETAVANAVDASEGIDFSADADGWFKVTPYGEFRGKTPGRPQHVTVENARAMEAEFNSLLGKLGRTFRGVPIYHGHPDVDPEIWPDDRRIGKITQLQARADGLWGYAEWNSVGQENKTQGWWIYPSPRWDAPPAQARFSPDRLISVGLTNTPRIEASEPIFNSLETLKTETTDIIEIMNTTLLRQKLGLAPEATEEEILAKIDKMAEACGRKAEPEAPAGAKPEAENAAECVANMLTEARQEMKDLRLSISNTQLDTAVADGRISAAERAAWAFRLAGSNREEEANALRALPQAINLKPLNLSSRREERKQGDDLREQVANSISKLQKDEGLTYHLAHLRAKKNPAFTAYFERSEG